MLFRGAQYRESSTILSSVTGICVMHSVSKAVGKVTIAVIERSVSRVFSKRTKRLSARRCWIRVVMARSVICVDFFSSTDVSLVHAWNTAHKEASVITSLVSTLISTNLRQSVAMPATPSSVIRVTLSRVRDVSCRHPRVSPSRPAGAMCQ